MGPNFSTNPLVASLKAASSRAEIRIAPETLIARSVLFSHRPYTVARETPSCAATSRTESRRSGVGGISEPLGTCSKPAARNFHLPAPGCTSGDFGQARLTCLLALAQAYTWMPVDCQSLRIRRPLVRIQ